MPTKILKMKNGTYRLAVTLGVDLRGKQIVRYKTIQAATQKDAQKQYRMFEAELLSGKNLNTEKLKLAEFARLWYKDYVKQELAPKTILSYKSHLEKRILPALGHLELQQLKPIDIIRFIRELQEKGVRYDKKKQPLSDKSIQYCFRVLSSMLQDAVEWQLIEDNPCLRVKRPRVKRKKIKIPSEEELQNILKSLKGEPLQYRAIIYLAIDSGLRRGEIVGLKWADIDFDSREVHVRRSNQSIPGQGTFSKTPKTEESVRTIVISAYTISLLKQLHTSQLRRKLILANKWHDEDWVFARWNGEALYDGTPSLWFSRFLKRKGLPHIHFHSLRHVSATILIAKGIPLKSVSSRLGHTDIKTTANIYVDAVRSVDAAAAEKMDDFFTGDETGHNAVKDKIIMYHRAYGM